MFNFRHLVHHAYELQEQPPTTTRAAGAQLPFLNNACAVSAPHLPLLTHLPVPERAALSRGAPRQCLLLLLLRPLLLAAVDETVAAVAAYKGSTGGIWTYLTLINPSLKATCGPG